MSYAGLFATNCGIPGWKGTNALFATNMFRSRHFAREAVTSLQIAYSNWLIAGAGVETASGGDMTLSAAIEYDGVSYPVLWSGGSSVVITNGATSPLSDALSVSIPADAEFFVRTFYSIAGNHLITAVGVNTTNAVGCSDNANGEDFHYNASNECSGTGLLTTGTNSVGLMYRPCLLVATITKNSFLLIGDSRQQGFRDVFTGSSSDRGQIARAVGNDFGYTNAGYPGEKASDFIASHALRVALADYVSHVVCEYGINDLVTQSAATLEGRVTTIAGYFSVPVYQTTLTVASTSSDDWATLANQTVDSRNAVRIAFNDLVRAGISGMTGYLEIADVVESARDSGKWAVDGTADWYTDDGVHETNDANIAIKDAAPPGAPTIGTATAGDGSASVTFTAPASVGLTAIESYMVTSSPGGFTGTGASSPIDVTGLTNGQAYTFTVTAINLLATGAASAATNEVTPIGAEITADVDQTEAGDTSSATAAVAIAAALSATEQSDTIASTAALHIVGAVAIAEADDAISAEASGASAFVMPAREWLHLVPGRNWVHRV